MKHTLMNKSWLFSLDGAEETMVNLPHDFSMTKGRHSRALSGKDGGWYDGGLGIYKKSFLRPEHKTVILYVDGCQGLTEIYINRNRVLFHPNGYTPFEVDLTPCLKDGENTLEIRVNSIGQPSARWYTGSGLYRKVELLTADEGYILPSGVYIRTENQAGNVFDMRAEIETSRDGQVDLTLISPDKNESIHLTGESKNGKALFLFSLKTDCIWTADTPRLWTATARFENDEETVTFGVRHVYIDKNKGLIVNGESVKLRGGCLHHDHGMLGARSMKDNEERRILLLKKAGFNAIRTSHNPPSDALLEVCDRLGMYVLDEAFDCWRQGKVPFDYHIFFDDWHERDLVSMLRRDRTHVSVLIWSNGNEIPERSGFSGGYEIMKRLSDIIKSMDNRPVTHALCSFWDVPELVEKQKQTENDPIDTWAEVTAPIAAQTDIAGYNYSHDRVEKDRLAFPERVFLLTETFALSAAASWKSVMDHDYVSGDFVWTAWDYIGESGIGHLVYDRETTRGLMQYPWHLANCADFDLTGFRRPQSYLREIVWGKRTAPYIAVQHPAVYARPCALSMWGFYDISERWSFKGYENKETLAYVFSDADEVELIVNGTPVARQTPDENLMCVFHCVYKPGEIRARAYKNGMLTGEFSIETPKEAADIAVRNVYQGEQAVYADIVLTDPDGNTAFEDASFTVFAAGASETYVSNGDPTTEESYTGNRMSARNGKITAAFIRSDKTINLSIRADVGGKTIEKELAL